MSGPTRPRAHQYQVLPERLATLVLEQAPLPLVVSDPDGTICWSNQPAQALFAAALNASDEPESPAARATWQLVPEDGEGGFRLRNSDAGLVGLTIEGAPIYDDGDVVAIVGALNPDAGRNADQLEASQRQTQERDLLDQVRTAIARELDVHAILRTVVESVAEVFAYPHVSAYLRQGDALKLQHQVGYGSVIDDIPRGKGVMWRVVESGQPRLLEDVAAEPEFLLAEHGTQSEVCVPLFDGREVVGVLNIEAPRSQPLDGADLQMMMSLAQIVNLAVERARLHLESAALDVQLRTVFDKSPVGILIADADGIVVDLNAAYLQLIGGPTLRDEIVGKLNLRDSDVYRKAGIDHLFKELFYGHAFAVEAPITTVTGRNTVVRYNAAPLFTSSGEQTGAVVVANDVSEQVRTQRALERRADAMEALYHTSLEISARRQLPELLNAIVQRASVLIGTQMGGLMLLQEDGATLSLVAGHNQPEEMLALRLKHGEGLAWQVLSARAPLSITDYPNYAHRLRSAAGAYIQRIVSVPLMSRDRALGVINCFDADRSDPFHEDDIALLQQFAAQAAIAIENVRLLDEVRAGRERMRQMNQIKSAILAAETQAEIAQSVVRHIKGLFGCWRADVIAFGSDASEGTFLAVESENENTAYGAGARFPIEDLDLLQDFSRGIPSIVRDLANETQSSVVTRRMLKEGMRAYISVPMVSRGELIGALQISSDQPDFFAPESLPLAREIASALAFALHNAQLFDAVKQQLDELTVLHAVAVAGADADNEDELIEQATAIVGDTLYPDNFGIALLDAAEGVLHAHPTYRTSEGVRLGDLPIGEGIIGHVAETGHALRVGDVQRDAKFVKADPKTRSELAVPLKAGVEVIGVINAESRRPGAFTESDERLLTTFGAHLATAIQNVRLLDANRRQTEALQRSNRLVSALVRVGAQLQSHLDFDLQMQSLGRELGALGLSISVGLIDEQEESIVIQYTSIKPNILKMAERLSGVTARGLRLRPDQFVNYEAVVLNKNAVFMASASASARAMVPFVPDPVFERAAAFIGLTPDIPAINLPLIVLGRVVGVLILWGRDLMEEDLPALTVFAGQVASAIDSARLFKAERQRTAELEAVRQATLQLTSRLTRPAVLDAILKHALELTQADDAHMFLYDHTSDTLTFGAARRGYQAWEAPFAEPRPEGLTYTVARSREWIVVEDMRTHPLFEDTGWRGAILGIPLVFDEQVRGVMNLAFDKPHTLHAEERRVLGLLADQVAVALENARLFEAEQRRAEQLAALQRLGQSVTAQLEFDEVLTQVIGQVREMVKADGVSILLPVGDELEFVAVNGKVGRRLQGQRMPASAGVAGRVIQSGAAVWVRAAADQKQLYHPIESLSDSAPQSMLAAPLALGGAALGVMEAVRDQPGGFGAGDLGLIEAAAHWTAIALQNARLFEAERRRAVERATLIDAARAASSSLQVDQVVSIVAERMTKLLGVTSCAVSLWDREQNTITLLAEHIRSGSEGDARWYEPVSVADYPETQRALEEARAVQMRIDDPQLYGSGRDYLREMKSSALLMVPLIHQDEVIGLVELFEVGAPRTFQPDNIELIEMLAAQAAAAIANARLFEQVLSGRERMQTLSRRLVGIQETERTRIARELHDEVGQILTAIKIGIQTACESPSLDAARASLRDNLEIVDDAIGRVRDLSLELRPAMLDDLGLVATLRWYLDRQAQLGGFTTSLQAAAMEPRLASEVEVTCFRVVQEALTNVIRHARASRVNVSLEHVDEELVVSVEDDGVGFDVEASTNRAAQGASVGLLGMQERVLQHGGVIEIASSTGRGTRINARIPTSEDLGLERRTTRRR